LSVDASMKHNVTLTY